MEREIEKRALGLIEMVGKNREYMITGVRTLYDLADSNDEEMFGRIADSYIDKVVEESSDLPQQEAMARALNEMRDFCERADKGYSIINGTRNSKKTRDMLLRFIKSRHIL